MSIRVMHDGADGYRLLSDGDETVGWVRGRTVGITGFADEERAIAAALAAYRSLEAWLARQRMQPLVPIGDGPFDLVHDGAHRWIASGQVPVARLPEALPGDDEHTAPQFAFEIVLRGHVTEGMAIHAALIAHRAARGAAGNARITWPARRRVSDGVAVAYAPVTEVRLEDR